MDATLEGLCARFEADPGDTVAFEAMEEAHFLAGEWKALVALYERRLESPDLAAATRAGARARMLVRLAQVLEERCVDLDAAEARYSEAIELDPGHRQALAQLRKLYATRERWDRYLAVAQQEMDLSMRPFERASFFTDVGQVWLRKLGDPQQAVAQFELALEADAEHADALLGLADAHAKQGAPDRAALALARAIERLRGTDRAPALVALGDLYANSLDQPERAHEAYTRALADDPESFLALEALAARAAAEKDWERFQELQERRYDAARNDVHRLTVAHDAGRVHLEDHADAEAARFWFARALELFPEDPVVHLYLADIERLSGNQQALSEHLKQAAALADDAAPVDLLQESAKLATDEGDDDFAVEQLKRALARDPGDETLRADLIGALTRLGRDGELIELLADEAERAEAGSPDQLAAWLRVGTHHEERLGDAERALEAYRTAFEIDPGSEVAALALGRALTAAQAWDALARMHEQVVAAENASTAQRVHAWCELGDLAMTRTNDVAAARDGFQQALALEPDCARAKEGLERVALADGDDDSLIDTFEREAQVTTDRERLGFLVWELARIFEAKDEPEQALHWLDHLTQASPEDVAALQACARLRESLGLREELVRNLERLDPLLHGDAQADNRTKIASLWLDLGDRAKAREALHAVLESRPDDVETLRRLEGCLDGDADRDELIDVRRQLVTHASGDERLATLDALARQLRERGDAAAALAAFSELLDSGAAAEDVGPAVEELLQELGHWEQLCARLAERREAMDPLDPEAFAADVARAELLLDRLDDPAAAIELFDLAREADPASERARSGLERALRRAGRSDRLAELLDEQAGAAADDEQRAKLTLERATLLEETLEQLPEAKTVLAGLADGSSGLAAEAQGRLLALLERTGDWATLRDRRRDELGQGSPEDDLALHLELADLSLERLEDRTAAIAHLESAAELAPDRAETWQRLAALYARAGDPASCLRALEAELATEPGLERTVLLRARAAELAIDALEDDDRAAAHFAALIELDRSHARAAEFLTGRFENEERHEELISLWQAQLDAMQPEDLERGADASLRLRMAALQAGPMGSVDEAIASLEPAADRDVTLPIVAEPLADLYERHGCGEQLLALATRAVDTGDVPEERAGWNLRIGDALRRQGELGRAADAYRRTLVDRPGDRGAQSALRELYRRLDEPEPLVRLLEAQLSEVAGLPEIPIRVELAGLLADSLDRGPDALVHLRRVLQLEPEHGASLERGLALAAESERHQDTLELLGLAIARTRDPITRASLLARRGALQADVLGQRREALESFRAAAELAPHDEELNRRVRELLAEHGEWAEALAALERAVAILPEGDGARETLLAEGAALAAEHVSQEAALPWLVRLRALRPEDPELLEKIAAIHRGAGRTEALLRTLEDEIALGPEAERRSVLEAERADLFERELHAPGRATAALEAARKASPDSVEILTGLERLYAAADRKRDLADVLDELIAHGTGGERLARRRTAARVWRELGDLETSIHHLWCALPDAGGDMERIEILRELQELWPRLGRRDLWARVAEAELMALDPAAPVFAERRRELRWLLADAYRSELARPDLAERHLRALLDGAGDEAGAHETGRAEEALLDLLRRSGDAVELERRLSQRLAGTESGDDATRAAGWLELARIRHERLHRIGDAADAYTQSLALAPDDVPALRGLRTCAERLGRHTVVAETLEKELELRPEASASERAALYRTLGELAWRELDETTRASSAFAAALEADPADAVSLRSLQSLFETMEDWRGAADLFESEVSLLGDDAPERRQAAWLRVGALARDHLDDPARALAAYDAAAEIEALELRERGKHAELLHVAGDAARFVEVFAGWLDAEGSGGEISDHLRLADVLEELGRHEAALARVERALALEPERCEAWDAVARLNDRLGRKQDAAQAHERAAACTQGGEAAHRRLAAALKVTSDEERMRLLDRAVADDPACAEAHARLAIAAGSLGQVAQAERAALRTTELGSASDLPHELLLEAALAGGRAARLQEHVVQALGLFDAVLSLEPDHPEALAGHGDVALRLGDAALARPSLERLLAGSDDHPDRATHLAQLGLALKMEGEADPALERFQAALELDPRLDEAHRGLAELYEREERIDEAVDALQKWAARTQEPDVRAGRLMHAARLELDRPDREEPAEALLREAVESLPGHAEAWTLLCQLLWAQGRVTEALDQATRAVEALGAGPESATCSLIRGRALEQRGDHRAAADAFQAATAADPRCSEGALSAARLLRALGEWRESADVLQAFVSSAPPDATEQLAPAWHQLGRLLAGPLEDVDGAIDVYRRAFDADPTLVDARHALADLLIHRPERWDEAVALHFELLAEDPTRLTSLRGLLHVARGRQRPEAVAAGLGILRALGCATPEERVEAPARLPAAANGTPVSDGTGEVLRQLAVEIQAEIGEALGVGGAGDGPPGGGAGDPIKRLRSALIRTEGELLAPALVPLTNEEVGAVLCLAAELALDVEAVHGDGDLVNALSQALGRRVRRRIRKTLGSVAAQDLTAVDWDRWRLELRAHAGLLALDAVDGELRSAFLAWLEATGSQEARDLPPESDLRDRVAAEPQTRTFLDGLISYWRQCL